MLYYRLLLPLVCPQGKDQLDIDVLWETLGVDPSTPFSEKFKDQAEQEIRNSGVAAVGRLDCLNGLIGMWMESVRRLNVLGVDDSLQVIYQTQIDDAQRKDKGKEIAGKARASVASTVIGTKEFYFDGQLLDNHIIDVLQWWNGQRSTRGVEEEFCGRCE